MVRFYRFPDSSTTVDSRPSAGSRSTVYSRSTAVARLTKYNQKISKVIIMLSYPTRYYYEHNTIEYNILTHIYDFLQNPRHLRWCCSWWLSYYCYHDDPEITCNLIRPCIKWYVYCVYMQEPIRSGCIRWALPNLHDSSI